MFVKVNWIEKVILVQISTKLINKLKKILSSKRIKQERKKG